MLPERLQHLSKSLPVLHWARIEPVTPYCSAYVSGSGQSGTITITPKGAKLNSVQVQLTDCIYTH